MKGNAVILALLVIVLACGGLGLWVDDTMKSNLARTEEARAMQMEYLARQEEAAARRAEAVKEKELYDAAGYAVETQADLVRWYAQRGDERAQSAVEWIVAFAVCGFVVWLAQPKKEPSACLPNEEGMLLEAPIRENTPTGN